ncbi:MAG: M20 family metallo-hydrolase [Alphaproteobacteria bacterium]|nr:M20 family metallo-hydrolase [Alphaproteobacteria bacterium]
MDVARHGATANGGVNRQALSAEDIAARRHVIAWAQQRGFQTFQDEIGNLFVRRDGTDPSLAPVMTGSHLDSQPTGGKFDGAYGVLAGLEVLEALNDAKIHTRRPIEVVAWTNEEGSRFSPGAMGSAIFVGARDLASVLDVRDPKGVVLRDALDTTLNSSPIPRRAHGSVRAHSYIEAHIEQGPILEEAGLPIGVVTGIQGSRRLNVDITGEEAHAGTAPRRARRDALSAAVSVIAALENLTRDDDDVLRFTVGRCEVFPGSPNTVPGRVHFTIDLRHPADTTLRAIGDRIPAVVKQSAKNCAATVTEVSYVNPTTFQAAVIDRVRASSDRLGFRNMDMPSGAGHDAMYLARVCPTGMIFVPCLRGVSHNEIESATPEELATGARVLADTLVSLAQE